MRQLYVQPVFPPRTVTARTAEARAASIVAAGLGSVQNSADHAPTPSTATRIGRAEEDLARVLAEWECGGAAVELRSTAADRIRAAVADHCTELDLSGLRLTSLPRCLPRHIQHLSLAANRLTWLPDLPPALTVLNCSDNPALRQLPRLPDPLEALYCDNTGLTGLPDLPNGLSRLMARNALLRELPALPAPLVELNVSRTPLRQLPPLPAGLRELCAAYCRLEVPPDAWPPHLQVLDLRGNRLGSVPALPMQLQLCELAGNRLRDIPANLLALPIMHTGQLAFDLAGNPLNAKASATLARFMRRLERLLSACGTAPHQASFALGRAAMDWFPASDSAGATWAGFGREAGAQAFAAFLELLHASPWRDSKTFSDDMRAWLDRLAGDAELRRTTFAISLDAAGACHDRALYALYGMRMQAVLADVAAGRHDEEPAALIELGKGFQAFEALTGLAQSIVAGRVALTGHGAAKEEIEVYLALVNRFRDLLPQVVRDAPMRYEGSAYLTPGDYRRVAETLRALSPMFPKFLSNWAPLHDALKRWNPSRYAAADAELRERVDNGGLEPYQRRHGFEGMVAVEALRHDLFGPLVRDYLDAKGIGAEPTQATPA